MTTLASNKRPLKCPVCERIVGRRARQQVFCSTQCRKRAARERTAGALKITARYPHSGCGTHPHKSSNENNNLQQPKTGSSSPRRGGPPRGISSSGIVGPRHVIQVEIIDAREWEEITSSDGVTSYVSYIGKRALIDGGAQ
jgi:endogenous inhibitor of DNA gyrase (YacG/DUF329 family)